MSWSEEYSESDHEEESTKQVNALTGVYDSDEESDDEELTFKGFPASYWELCIKSEEICQ